MPSKLEYVSLFTFNVLIFILGMIFFNDVSMVRIDINPTSNSTLSLFINPILNQAIWGIVIAAGCILTYFHARYEVLLWCIVALQIIVSTLFILNIKDALYMATTIGVYVMLDAEYIIYYVMTHSLFKTHERANGITSPLPISKIVIVLELVLYVHALMFATWFGIATSTIVFGIDMIILWTEPSVYKTLRIVQYMFIQSIFLIVFCNRS